MMAKSLIKEQQLRDILIRLSYLEERERQRTDGVPALQRIFQTFETKTIERDKRRQDQFLALQENSVLLLQRLLSFKNDVASARRNCERDFEQARKDWANTRDRLSAAEQRTLELESKMNIEVTRERIKDELDDQVHGGESCDRVDTIHKQPDESHKRIQMIQSRKTVVEINMKEIADTNMLMLQSEIEKIQESNNIKMKEFREGIEEKVMDSIDKKWQQMLIFQKEMGIGVDNFHHSVDTKIEQIREKLNQTLLETIDSKMERFGKKMETGKWVRGEEVEQKIQKCLHIESQDLQSKLNAKFQESYDSQMKLLSINLGRKCQEETKKMSQEISGEQAGMKKKLKLHQDNMKNEMEKRFQECGLNDLEKHVQKACSEQRILLQTEIDQKLCTHDSHVQKIIQNEIENKFQEGEKVIQRAFSEQRILLQAEADQKLQIHNLHNQKTLQLEIDRIFKECGKMNTEKHVQKACSDQRILLEVDQKLQIHNMQTQKVIRSEIDRKFQERGVINLEKHVQRACSDQRTLLQTEVDQKIQIHMQTLKNMQSKIDMIQEQFQEIYQTQIHEMATKIQVIHDWIHKELQSHLETTIKDIFDSRLKISQKKMDRKFDEI